MPQLAAISAISALDSVRDTTGVGTALSSPAHAMNFADMVAQGLKSVDAKVAKADALIQAYAVGDPVPVHQVTLAIAEARMAVEMSTQIRSRLVETYHDFLNMQL